MLNLLKQEIEAISVVKQFHSLIADGKGETGAIKSSLQPLKMWLVSSCSDSNRFKIVGWGGNHGF